MMEFAASLWSSKHSADYSDRTIIAVFVFGAIPAVIGFVRLEKFLQASFKAKEKIREHRLSIGFAILFLAATCYFPISSLISKSHRVELKPGPAIQGQNEQLWMRPFTASISMRSPYLGDLTKIPAWSTLVEYKNFGSQPITDFYSLNLLYALNTDVVTKPEVLVPKIEKLARDTYSSGVPFGRPISPGEHAGISGSMANDLANPTNRKYPLILWKLYFFGSARWNQNGVEKQTSYCQWTSASVPPKTLVQNLVWNRCEAGNPLDIAIIPQIEPKKVTFVKKSTVAGDAQKPQQPAQLPSGCPAGGAILDDVIAEGGTQGGIRVNDVNCLSMRGVTSKDNGGIAIDISHVGNTGQPPKK